MYFGFAAAESAISQPSSQGYWADPVTLRPTGFAGLATKAVHSILIPPTNKVLCIDQDRLFNSIRISCPTTGFQAPPGYHMLFVCDQANGSNPSEVEGCV